MATSGHALSLTDAAIAAFLISRSVGDASTVVAAKSSSDKSLPLVVCHCQSADRGRARNWLIKGEISVHSAPLDSTNADNAAVSTALERGVVEAFEAVTNDDDSSNAASAITSAAADATGFQCTSFRIQDQSAAFDESGTVWIFSVRFEATVIC